MPVRALIVNCSLKKSPEESNTQKLAEVVADELRGRSVEVSSVRLADAVIPPGVSTDLGDDDGWPAIHDRILESDIVIFASPTWLARPSSLAQRALERMDAMLSETDDQDRPVAYNRVAGVVVTGNEDGAHHVISEIGGALGDLGFTVPGQAFTYWNMGPGPGPDYSDTDHGHDYAAKTGALMAHNLYSVATALAATPIPAHKR